MLEFFRRNRVFLTSGFFLSLSFALLSANRFGPRRVDPLGMVFLEALRPLQIVTAAVAARASRLWSRYVSLVGVVDENRRLREQLRLLETEGHRVREIELENERLQRLLEFRSRIPGDAVTARVTTRDASGWFHTFALDRGESHGIRPGMAVVADGGVVGRIAQSSPHASRVLLISDHNSGIDALVQRTRARGILEGTLEGHCSLQYVARDEEIAGGDVVVTSGLDGLFPKGLLIGTVAGVTSKDSALFQTAAVMPAVDFSQLEEVLVVTSPPAEMDGALDRPAAAAGAAITVPPVPPQTTPPS